ncbi:MAG TPA: phosphoenolpyruvate carboxykinase [Actinomycetota bacterium]|nr:phosphoenolpyruvate carboxykinase [Actinomycetota bacterium]
MRARRIYENPPPEELRRFTEEMPNCRITEFGNVNVQTRVTARSSQSTFIVTDDPSVTDGKTMSREEYERLARYQDDYIADQEMLVVDGYIGNVPEVQTAARLVIEKRNANIAGMQQKLYYPREGGEPELQLIYTPNLPARGYPDDRCIAVDLEHGVTRVLGSDYFGESKKGGLRMWNRIVYELGGLALHAGCKVVPANGEERTFLIIGLSGTGKTTTTFTTQNDSLPVQDDFVALMPGGTVHGSENGCFAKTFSLDPEFEPNIYRAVTSPGSYLENVYQDESGKVNFFETSYTKNGRAVFCLADLGAYRDARTIGKVDYLLILNWNENIIPAVARLSGVQAAAYFMLGETTGTSAGGKAEEGKFLRVPGTNPFFPLRHGLQGMRFLDLLQTHPMEVYLMNTGRVGGKEDDPRSKKVTIPHSSAIVKAIAERTIKWDEDPDFGYEVAAEVPGVDDPELLQPRRLYERQGRLDEYQAFVERFKRERVETLRRYPDLAEEIVRAVG